MTKEHIREVIDSENGKGFSNNINLNGYVFTKNESFIVFELSILEDVKICNIKYIHYKNEKDLTTILVHCCNFWMGNKIQFIYYKEKNRSKNPAMKYLKDLNFRVETIDDYKWKYRFDCEGCEGDNKKDCSCIVFNLFK